MSLKLIGVILEGTSPLCKQEIAAGRGMRRGLQLDFLKKQKHHPRANGLLLILPVDEASGPSNDNKSVDDGSSEMR